ncbi:hypothetical protein HPP92_021354 [Vanilla planifolia]|uniref:Uncharacterized protein n=1 Tax=Vanilla planifolia TaxID=51239 RepID=A0A835UIP7_VANPL|nr:hypothetical protein HPP92_021354 [Vanilla planifolia]
MCWELYNQPSKETYVDVAKGIIRNVPIGRAFLLLLPEAVEVLGGLAEDLDAARHRFISEVNKPPRGKRKQALIPLSQRAALVSWPSTNVNGGTANTLVPASDICISQPNALESPSLSNPKPMAQDLFVMELLCYLLHYSQICKFFCGTILVELNKESPFPVALEMSQDCTASDAWLLLRRLKSFAFEKLQHGLIEPIILSP